MFFVWEIYRTKTMPSLQSIDDYRKFVEKILRALVPLRERRDYSLGMAILQQEPVSYEQYLNVAKARR